MLQVGFGGAAALLGTSSTEHAEFDALLAQIATYPAPARQQVQECFNRIVSQECVLRLAEVRHFLRAHATFVSSDHVQNAPATPAAMPDLPAPGEVASQLMHVLLRDVHLATQHTAIDIEEDAPCFDDLRSGLVACLNFLPYASDEAETQAATSPDFQDCGADVPVADTQDISNGSSASHRRRRMHAAFCPVLHFSQIDCCLNPRVLMHVHAHRAHLCHPAR